MGDTVPFDSSLTVLAALSAIILAAYLRKTSKVAVKSVLKVIIGIGGFWQLYNWIAHLIAVSLVNVQRLETGSFTYSFHFYSLMLMGIVFAGMSALVLYYFLQMTKDRNRAMPKVKLLCAAVIVLSLPIAPTKPVGLLRAFPL
ncbi:hypothetical protein [Pontibacter akesuensis]|uniref:Uncharacterized protein n=1 Tax=Pontibacter akesuensis TaxID=388950 RepID=A0A1I7KX33_9BACT|nr:hypothetical protein [Pontibacter akesuensis]GHA78583.1 hypothetical protein GCM10007389_35980 [Pontibacter akesuensis]SFV02062.1 hypothetical protein SAMN04487941_0069 [Pontibacter akesuensis]